MKQYITADPWMIIEDGFHGEYQKISESLFSIGNGRMGQRANHEEGYHGETLQGSYLAGIYYPDKTRVGWWKNGYPEYFAKVLNSPNWIALELIIDDRPFDMNEWEIRSFQRVLNMKEGLLSREMEIHKDDLTLFISAQRICHYLQEDCGLISYTVHVLEGEATLQIISIVDSDVRNSDANYDEDFWTGRTTSEIEYGLQLSCRTRKTDFQVSYSMGTHFHHSTDGSVISKSTLLERSISQQCTCRVQKGETLAIDKYVIVHTSLQVDPEAQSRRGTNRLREIIETGSASLFDSHRRAWREKWEESDIQIKGDVAAQQGIRFNMFQLHQTYTGNDARLNIGPKGFTGEKYGGSTYWDTEAYCLPFYLATAPQNVARNLLIYRFRHLDKAIQNAEKLGFGGGAALYPMVTMTGEECHNEWEITFEEIHRNGAIAYAIYYFEKYSGDTSYRLNEGAEVLVAIARFWSQRVHFSVPKQAYVMHGVTGPNEYENNINNNWYTNFIARWCLRYAIMTIEQIMQDPQLWTRLQSRTDLSDNEIESWQQISDTIYLPSDQDLGVFLQQEGFLDKEIRPATSLQDSEIPLHEHWSWDRILRSCFIKQADVLQGLFFFEDQFDTETIKRNFEFYEPLTVHESSLSPCVHSVLASVIGDHQKAYDMYLRTARLDLDDYNNDTDDGCHITSMAGTWLAIVHGFAGMRILNDTLSFLPTCPEPWESYCFRIGFRNRVLDVEVSTSEVSITMKKGDPLTILIGEQHIALSSTETKICKL